MRHRKFDNVIDRLGTYSTQWDYVEDRFGEKDLLPFTISDTDFAAPDEILNALTERFEHPVFGYTRWNHKDYKESITQWFSKRFDADVNDNWIVYSPSVIYSISKLIELKSDIGDGVVIQTPAYDAFFNMIPSLNRKTVENPLNYSECSYSINFEDLENKLSDSSTKILILCSPHNPTGLVWSMDDLTRIVNLCKMYDVFIISDEIHMDIVFKESRHIPITTFVKEYDQIALCSSPSKTFNVPGLGGSYLFVPEDKLRDDFQDILKKRDGLSSASIPGIISTMAAYKKSEYWVNNLNEYVYDNLIYTKSFLDENIPDITFEIPDATYLAWIDTSNLPYSMDELQQALVSYGKVAIMYGSVYGGNGSNFLRLNVGCPRNKLIEGLDRLKKSIEYLENRAAN